MYHYFKVHRNESLNQSCLSPDLTLGLTLSGSNYPYLDQILMVLKMSEPLKFHYILMGANYFLFCWRPNHDLVKPYIVAVYRLMSDV